MKSLVITCLICFSLGYSHAQDVSTGENIRYDLFQPHKSVGWDLGMDYSAEPSYRIGFARTHEVRSCVVGSVRSGLAAGLSMNPELSATGVYINDWLSIGPLNLGLKLSYENNNRFQWMTLQPQIGLGLQNFRLFYGYNAAIFFTGRTAIPKHILGIGYTFNISEL